MANALSAPHLQNEDAAFAYVEARLWPNGPICSHCGESERVSRMGGKATRKGLHKCYACRKQFTVRQGTIFESSHLPLNVWLQAIFLIASSKKGISSQQLHRMLGTTLKTAWFLSHRIREAMRSDDLSPFGAGGGIVEADETFIGVEPHARLHGWRAGGPSHRHGVLLHLQAGVSGHGTLNFTTRRIQIPDARKILVGLRCGDLRYQQKRKNDRCRLAHRR